MGYKLGVRPLASGEVLSCGPYGVIFQYVPPLTIRSAFVFTYNGTDCGVYHQSNLTYVVDNHGPVTEFWASIQDARERMAYVIENLRR